MAYTPVAGTNHQVTTGGTAVQAIPASPNGGLITNPYAATEPLYVNAVTTATTTASGTTFALQPGQSWSAIPSQTTQTSVNAATSGHVFSVIYW